MRWIWIQREPTRLQWTDDEDKGAVLEMSNPGRIGVDTKYQFKSPKTGETIRVIAKIGEPRSAAIARVKERHGAK